MKYFVQVKFNKNFVEVEGNKIIVGVTSKPKGGKANGEMLRKIAKHFGVSVSRITIRLGATSPRKIVEILN